MKLSEAFHAASAALFPKNDEGERQPDYKGLFVQVVSSVLTARKVKFDAATLQKVADHVNLSSFQRGAAAEAAKRYGPSDQSGGARMAPVKTEPKAKKTGVRAIDGEAKPKKDRPANDPKTNAAKPAPKKSVGDMLALKKAERAAKDKARRAGKKAKAADIDPITGEAV